MNIITYFTVTIIYYLKVIYNMNTTQIKKIKDWKSKNMGVQCFVCGKSLSLGRHNHLEIGN